MQKTVIIINGRGGCGKDTLCDIAGRSYKVLNFSSITPIKQLAREAGWKGEKDPRSRKMLADLKKILCDYNDLCTNYLLDRLDAFLESENDNEIMFAHIREASEIDKFKKAAEKRCRVVTLLVKRETEDYSHEALGNSSDDEVETYDYDHVFVNDAPDLTKLAKRFNSFLKKILADS